MVRGDGSTKTASVVDGRVTVKVLVRSTAARKLKKLAALGFRLRQVGSGWVVGDVEVAKLVTLAELKNVLRVELP